jgi:hypothetical protein
VPAAASRTNLPNEAEIERENGARKSDRVKHLLKSERPKDHHHPQRFHPADMGEPDFATPDHIQEGPRAMRDNFTTTAMPMEKRAEGGHLP